MRATFDAFAPASHGKPVCKLVGVLRLELRLVLRTRAEPFGNSNPGAEKQKGHPRDGLFVFLVERRRIELPTFALRTRRSPS